MDFWGDRRGQPVQIGFILLFGILVLAFASYQGYVVPNQNANIEVNHFETVEDQFAEFDTNAVNAVGIDVERSSSFALGVQYPSRLIALNPPPVSGRLETTAPRRVSVVNDTGHEKTGRICGTEHATSRSLVYTPQYHEYGEVRSLTYENTFVTRSFRERDLHGEQRLVRSVDGGPDRIDLLLLNRSVSVDRQGTYSLKMEGTHRYSSIVDDPNVTIATQFNSSAWNDEILADRSDVTVSDAGTGRVTLDFANRSYKVSCAVVGLNGEPEFEPPEDSAADSSTFDTQWVAADGEAIEDSSLTAEPGDTVTLTAEIRGRDSRNAIVDKQFSCDDVDIADDTEAFASCSFPNGTTTDSQGQVDVDIDLADSNAVNEGDRLEVYLTAGDDSDYVTIEIVTDDPPTATIDDVRDTSSCSNVQGGGNCPTSADTNYAEFEVDWSATDDREIQSVTLELVDNKGSVVDSVTPSASGTSASGTETLREEGGYGEDYTIRLVVTDSAGQQDVDTVNDTADGNDPA